MTGLILRLQLRTWARDRRLLAMLGGIALALVVASSWSTAQDIARQTAQEEAAEPELPSMAGRHAYDGVLFDAVIDRHQTRLGQEDQARSLARTASWAAPPLALTLVLEGLAGVGPEAAAAYRGYLMDAVQARIEWILVKTWSQQPLTPSDFEALTQDPPEPYQWQAAGLGGPALVLLAWTAAAWLWALAALRRSERD